MCPHYSIYRLPHLHPHLWRRTRSMHLYLAGVPLPLVSEWLGHSSIETTQIYARATNEMKRQALSFSAPLKIQPGDRCSPTPFRRAWGDRPGSLFIWRNACPCSVRQGNLGTINRNRLDAPYPAKTAVIVQGFRTAEEIQDIFKAFLENGVADTSSCFAESLHFIWRNACPCAALFPSQRCYGNLDHKWLFSG